MFIIEYKHIKIVQKDIGTGTTNPKFAVLDNDEQVIIKLYNGIQGNLVLFNEYICYRLARLLKINMPISGICYVDNSTELLNNDVKEENFGYGFYSTYLGKAAIIFETIIPLIENKEEFFTMLLFDHVIFNTDRNWGNLLVQYYKNKILLNIIDHTHVFINQSIWDSQCLERGIEENDYISTQILEENQYLYDMFFRNLGYNKEKVKQLVLYFKEIITYDKLNQIIQEVPSSWLPTNKDVNTLIKYILYRIEHLDDIRTMIENYLKK